MKSEKNSSEVWVGLYNENQKAFHCESMMDYYSKEMNGFKVLICGTEESVVDCIDALQIKRNKNWSRE